MTTSESKSEAGRSVADDAALPRLEENMRKIDALTKRMMSALSHKRDIRSDLQAPSPELYMKAAGAYWQEMVNNPAKMMEAQVGYWAKVVNNYVEAQKALASGKFEAPEDDGPADRRFTNPLWQTHPYFNLIKKQYLANADAVRAAVSGIEGLEPQDARRLNYFSQQIVDLMSPTNFLATNPDALEKAIETEGKALFRGWKTLFVIWRRMPVIWWLLWPIRTRSKWGKTLAPRRARWCSATICWN